MASLKKTAAKKVAATKTTAKKVSTPRTAVAKKVATKKATGDKPEIKKGSKFACQICGFAFTVDRICGCLEEAHLICCESPMKLKRQAAKKK
jgi:hypothetical protein